MTKAEVSITQLHEVEEPQAWAKDSRHHYSEGRRRCHEVPRPQRHGSAGRRRCKNGVGHKSTLTGDIGAAKGGDSSGNLASFRRSLD